MDLTTQEVKKIARLARIKIEDEAEIEKHKKELNKIFDLIDHLQEVNTDGVAPMTSVEEDMVLPMREDKVTDGNIAEDVLKNSEYSKYGYFIVPKVIE